MKKIEGAAPAIGPYSAGVAAGELLFVSGQLPVDAEGKFPLGIKAQTAQCIENLKYSILNIFFFLRAFFSNNLIKRNTFNIIHYNIDTFISRDNISNINNHWMI